MTARTRHLAGKIAIVAGVGQGGGGCRASRCAITRADASGWMA